MNSSLLKVLLFAPLVGWAAASCGGASTEVLTSDSNTNWLKKCELDSDCVGALSCLCGICSQPCGTSAECSRLSGANCAESASDQCSGQAGAGAMCVLACTSDSECNDGFICRSAQCVPDGPLPGPAADAGQPVSEGAPTGQAEACRTVSWDTLWETLETDLLRQDADDRAFVRYITLANELGAGICGAALQPYRRALGGALNSVSREVQIRQPELIPGETETYRIDLRDYGLDDAQGPFVVGGQAFVDGWELVIANSPYAIEFQGDQAENVSLLTQTTVPLLFADAFIDRAMSGEVYYGLVGIPATQVELEQQLGIDVAADDAQDITVRAGSNVRGRDFVAERHEQPIGGLYYWQTADFGLRQGELFTDPLGPLRGEREVVFNLPNGLLAFALYDAAGARVERSTVLSDGAERGGVYLAARSSLRRYGRGFVVADEVRQDVLDNLIDYGGVVDIDALLERYPAELSEIVADDAELVQAVLARAGVLTTGPEPISLVLGDFAADVALAGAAGDTLFPAELLANEVARLDPALSGLDNGFRVGREDWSLLFLHSLCVLSVANENRPHIDICAEVGVLSE